jgi:hypothetical protein
MVERLNAKIHVINIKRKPVWTHVVTNTLTAVIQNQIADVINGQNWNNAFQHAKTAQNLAMVPVISIVNSQLSKVKRNVLVKVKNKNAPRSQTKNDGFANSTVKVNSQRK